MSMLKSADNLADLTSRLIETAIKAGAIHADALAVCDTGDSISVRNGIIESVEREDSQGFGLRAFVETPGGLAFATASSSDLSDTGLQRLAEQVVSMARISEPDPDAMPPVGAEHPDQQAMQAWMERHPPAEPGWTLDQAREAATVCEEIARTYSDQISNSEGAHASFGHNRVAYASSDGFAAQYGKASASLSVSVIAGSGESMQRDYGWHRALHASKLKSPEAIATEAAERAINRLGSSGMEAGRTHVIFEPRTATSLLGHLMGAVNGRAVLQQRSFLADAIGEMVFPEFVTITDDPDHPQGLSNRLFDGEGTRSQRNIIIDQGRLNTILADRYTAARLGRTPTGSAARGLTGDIGIGSANLIMQPGVVDQAALLNEIGNGVLITELIGFGVNAVTGDYSRGAGGFLIENGKIVRPVQGITIAGNLKDMFAGITHLGSDLTWFGSTAVPTIAIEGMTIASQ